MTSETVPDLILHRGLFTTLDRSKPSANAVAIKDGRFVAVGTDKEVTALAGPEAIAKLRLERLRDGAYYCAIYEDSATPTHMVETFLVPSWLEHQRQHHRVSHADREVQDSVRRFHKGQGDPIVRHLIAAAADVASPNSDKDR